MSRGTAFSFPTTYISHCAETTAARDVYTHCYNGSNVAIISADGGNGVAGRPGIDRAVLAAKERGVFFDVGHGQGAFLWGCAEAAVAGGLWPDSISTDLHMGNVNGPVYVRQLYSSTHPSTYLPTYLPTYLSIYLSIYLFEYLNCLACFMKLPCRTSSR